MELPILIYSDSILEIFHSLYEGGPFKSCLICSRDLLTEDVIYTIQKTFAGDEPICEFAVCLDCMHELREEFSEESLQRVAAHFEERVDFDHRYEQLAVDGTDMLAWIDNCVLTKKKRSECNTYAVYAECIGSGMFFADLP